MTSTMASPLWLDPTDADTTSRTMNHGSKSSSHPIPPLPLVAPVIPPRTSQPHSRRRPVATSRRQPEKERQPAPSPEIISNLIDSLATSSFPDLPTSEHPPSHLSVTSNAPSVRHARSFDSNTVNSFVRDYGSLRTALQQDLSTIDDAAEPPVIRTSKKPSGFSALTAPRPNKRDSSLRMQLQSPIASQSNTSLLSLGSVDDVRSIGTPSIERRRSVGTPTRESFDSQASPRRGSKVLANLKYQSNRSNRRDQPVNGTNGDIVQYLYSPGPASPTRAQSIVEEPILEEPFPAPDFALPPGFKREGKKPMKEVKMGSPNLPQGPAVPNRRSSLRHQDIPTPSRTRSHSPQPRAVSNPNELLPEEDEPKTLTAFNSLDGEENIVTKRIKELKAKKEMRDRELRESPPPEFIKVPTQTFLEPPSRTPARSPRDGPQLSSHKLRKTPGVADIHVHPNGTPVGNISAPPSPLTPTPLPINYSFVVQSLDEQERPPSRSSLSRRLSLVIAGRSTSLKPAAQRNNKIARSDVANPVGVVNDRQSLDSRQPKEGSATRPRRPSSGSGKKKRWSHPDLNFGVERRSSVKTSDVHSNRAAPHPDSVAEERPTSKDSVDQAVDSFMYAQRLSQKIRHPETGRIISFSEVGDPKGNVVFCCVGMGLTRFVTAFYDELATTLKLRLVTPDRPGVGDSQTDANGTPLSWPDDVLLICSALNITKFSILAHSAGAIYALATALRIPQHIRGKVHLLAPWIPPSQMEPIGLHQDPPPAAQLPKSQRFLRALPAPFLKVANSSFLSATSASLSPNLGTPNLRKKRKSRESRESRENRSESPGPNELRNSQDRLSKSIRSENIMLMDREIPNGIPNGSAMSLVRNGGSPTFQHPLSGVVNHQRSVSAPARRQEEDDPEFRRAYDERLTLNIWANATTNANPAVDLLVCLERSQSIGFRYVDITRAVVIHHGSKDSRVPLENVKWLGNMMRRCEVRVLDGEGHGLMASAAVMGGVLTEMAKEWDDWHNVVSKGRLGN